LVPFLLTIINSQRDCKFLSEIMLTSRCYK